KSAEKRHRAHDGVGASQREQEIRAMMRKMALLGGAAMLLASGAAQAETLHEALEAAYRSNPTLTAQRAQVRAGDENVPIARAAGRPTLEASAVYQENVLKGD